MVTQHVRKGCAKSDIWIYTRRYDSDMLASFYPLVPIALWLALAACAFASCPCLEHE